MSLSDHAWRPLFYRTRRPWWRRLRNAFTAFLLVLLLAIGASFLVTRLEATDAQLRNAHAQGMTAGLLACPGR